jgi:hypothetical protein
MNGQDQEDRTHHVLANINQCLSFITHPLFYSCPVHCSYQENNVGKQEKFKDIKWLIIHNKLRIGNTLVKRKNRTQDRTIIYKN